MAFIPVHSKPFVWVDTETTGLDPDLNDIIEIAIVRVNPDGSEKVIHAKIRMERPENAHPRALEVNGYTDEAWAGAASVREVFEFIHNEKILQDCILAGQNVGFDSRFINATFKRLGIDARVDYHLYDTCTLALEHLKPWVSSVSLVPICVALGIPTDGAHGAMADCRMAMEVDRKLRQATAEDRSRWASEIPPRLAAWEASRRR